MYGGERGSEVRRGGGRLGENWVSEGESGVVGRRGGGRGGEGGSNGGGKEREEWGRGRSWW